MQVGTEATGALTSISKFNQAKRHVLQKSVQSSERHLYLVRREYRLKNINIYDTLNKNLFGTVYQQLHELL